MSHPGYKTQPIPTMPRIRWLATCSWFPSKRPAGPVGAHCQQLGWTHFVGSTGLERLTPKGRAVLRAWQKANPDQADILETARARTH